MIQFLNFYATPEKIQPQKIDPYDTVLPDLRILKLFVDLPLDILDFVALFQVVKIPLFSSSFQYSEGVCEWKVSRNVCACLCVCLEKQTVLFQTRRGRTREKFAHSHRCGGSARL